MVPLIDTADEVRSLISALRATGASPGQIAERVGVDVRTVYRWSKGDSGPQNSDALANLNTMLKEERRGA